MKNLNRVVLQGNLTRDPELRQVPSGTTICELGIAVNDREKDSNGEWAERANFFTVDVFGKQGENCHRYLSKGRPVLIEGRLRWHSWETDGIKRSKVTITGENVYFLGTGDGHRASAPASEGQNQRDVAHQSLEPPEDEVPF